jgi:hypothetical protein
VALGLVWDFLEGLAAGSVALSLCTTAAHSIYTIFTNIFGASISNVTMRPKPRLGAGIDRRDPGNWGTPAASTIFADAGVIHPFGATHCEVRKTPSWPRSWANFSLLQLYLHRNAWANLHIVGQPNTFIAAGGVVCARYPGGPRQLRRAVGDEGLVLLV